MTVAIKSSVGKNSKILQTKYLLLKNNKHENLYAVHDGRRGWGNGGSSDGDSNIDKFVLSIWKAKGCKGNSSIKWLFIKLKDVCS